MNLTSNEPSLVDVKLQGPLNQSPWYATLRSPHTFQCNCLKGGKDVGASVAVEVVEVSVVVVLMVEVVIAAAAVALNSSSSSSTDIQ